MANEERPAKRTKLDFNDHIRVLVGPSKKEFVVHKDIITRRSPFFKAATLARWNGTRPIELPDDKPKVFAEYLHCLYVGSYSMDSTRSRTARKETVLIQAIDLYVLADKLGDLETANTVIDSIPGWSDELSWQPTSRTTAHAYAQTSEGSPLRSLLVDFSIQEGIAADFKGAPTSGPSKFYMDVSHEYLRRVSRKITSGKSFAEVFRGLVSSNAACTYHQHNDVYPRCVPDDSDSSSDSDSD
ncbi:hypothetical protein LTS10_007826 [Elasticomyces elasticus]|nr:hypothetical protein LTS10_007826 [Elasticomyces elasticus]